MNMYYSTYRSANEINLSKWKDNLKEEKILEIEEKCYDLMLKFGYKFTLYIQQHPYRKGNIQKLTQYHNLVHGKLTYYGIKTLQ